MIHTGRFQFAPTPVRVAIDPWIATVIQGSMGSFEGVSTGNAHSPSQRTGCHGVTSNPSARDTSCVYSRSHPCEIRHFTPGLPL
jgi:hypothetical protein